MKENLDISKIKESFDSIRNEAPEGLWNEISENLEKGSDVDSIVKESFTSINALPPSSLMAEVLSELVDPIDSVVQKSFEEYIVSAPDDLWNKVDTQLETDLVWKKIENQIVVKTQKWKTNAVAAAIVVLISLVPNFLRDDFLSQKTNSVFSELAVQPTGIKNITAELVRNHHKISEADPVLHVHPQAFSQSESIDSQSEEGVVLRDDDQMSNINYLSSPEINEIANATVAPTLELDLKDKKKKRFSLGLMIGLNRTWLIDNETRSSFEKNSLIESKLVFGSMVGLTAQYEFGEKSFVAANYILNATSRNKIGKFNDGVYQHKISEIKLSQFSLMYGRSFILGIRNKWNLNTKIGPYLGLIRSSQIKEGDVITSYNNNFKRVDYGLNLQIAPVYKVGNFELETGLNYELGLRNIFVGNGYIASDLNYTNNTDLGIYLALRYKLGK